MKKLSDSKIEMCDCLSASRLRLQSEINPLDGGYSRPDVLGSRPCQSRTHLVQGRWKLGTLLRIWSQWARDCGVEYPGSWLLISGIRAMQPKAQYNKPVYNSLEAVQKKLLEISLYHSMLKKITNFDHKTQMFCFQVIQ